MEEPIKALVLQLVTEMRNDLLSRMESPIYFEDQFEKIPIKKPMLSSSQSTKALVMQKSEEKHLASTEHKVAPSRELKKSRPTFDKETLLVAKDAEQKAQSVVARTVTSSLETSPLDEMKLLFKKHNQMHYREEIPCFIKLLTTNDSSLAFLQKLELAISDAFLPAKAYFVTEANQIHSHLTDPLVKFLLAPLHELLPFLNMHKGPSIHELTKIDHGIVSLHWMPLHPCAHYLKDPGLKRSLWNILKSLPFADLLV